MDKGEKDTPRKDKGRKGNDRSRNNVERTMRGVRIMVERSKVEITG